MFLHTYMSPIRACCFFTIIYLPIKLVVSTQLFVTNKGSLFLHIICQVSVVSTHLFVSNKSQLFLNKLSVYRESQLFLYNYLFKTRASCFYIVSDSQMFLHNYLSLVRGPCLYTIICLQKEPVDSKQIVCLNQLFLHNYMSPVRVLCIYTSGSGNWLLNRGWRNVGLLWKGVVGYLVIIE